MVNILKARLISTMLAIVALLACTDSGMVDARPVLESPYDPFVEPKTNINLMNEVLLFELSSRIDKAVSEKFGEVLSASYEINGIRADGHGGFSVRIHGRIAHGSVIDEINIYFDSPHFKSGLVFSRIDIIHKNERFYSGA